MPETSFASLAVANREFPHLPPEQWPTRRQFALFQFIFSRAQRFGYQPTIREIGRELGIASPSGVSIHLRGLARKDWIELGATESRSVRFLRTPAGQTFRGFGDPI